MKLLLNGKLFNQQREALKKNMVKKNFKFVNKSNLIQDPLKLPKRLSDNFVKYLKTIYKMSKSGESITSKALANALHIKNPRTIVSFFNRNDYPEYYIKIDKKNISWKYELTKKGYEALSIIKFFKQYYSNC